MTIVEYQSNQSPQQCCIPSSSPWLILEKAKTDMWGGLERPQVERAQSMRRIPVAGRPGSNTPGLKSSCQIAVVSTPTRVKSVTLLLHYGVGWPRMEHVRGNKGHSGAQDSMSQAQSEQHLSVASRVAIHQLIVFLLVRS